MTCTQISASCCITTNSTSKTADTTLEAHCEISSGRFSPFGFMISRIMTYLERVLGTLINIQLCVSQTQDVNRKNMQVFMYSVWYSCPVLIEIFSKLPNIKLSKNKCNSSQTVTQTHGQINMAKLIGSFAAFCREPHPNTCK